MAPAYPWILIRFVPTIPDTVADPCWIGYLQIGIAGAIVWFIGRITTIIEAITEPAFIDALPIRTAQFMW
uniref:Uncharacterized protein n=1 Tax=Anopheles darlingi TaxID=43151 RepID=A0A2M4DK62_ANODA